MITSGFQIEAKGSLKIEKTILRLVFGSKH